jgi:Holliday junction resolvase RusA-like endonuclease
MDERNREELSLIFTINIAPVTKKNHGQIVWRNKRPIMIPSKQYLQYEKDCKYFMPSEKTEGQVNVKALFYMPTRRRVDLVNLLQALLDVLVKYGVIEDDNSNVVVSVDGSKVLYDKENARTEVEITEIRGDYNE